MSQAKCPKCNSTDFYVHETIVWKAFASDEPNEAGQIFAHKDQSNDIEFIECRQCNTDLTEKFKDSVVFS